MNGSDDLVPKQALLTMQIIVIALVLGVLMFVGVALNIVLNRPAAQGPPADGLPILLLVAVVLFATNAPLSFILPQFITRTALRQITRGTWKSPAGEYAQQPATLSGKLLLVRQTTLIVGLALLEGSAFFSCTVYLLEGNLIALGLVGAAVALMIVRFPTESRVRSWLEQQAEALARLQEEDEMTRRS